MTCPLLMSASPLSRAPRKRIRSSMSAQLAESGSSRMVLIAISLLVIPLIYGENARKASELSQILPCGSALPRGAALLDRPGGPERITNIEQGMVNVQVLWRSAQDYGLTTWVLKVLCSLGSVLFSTGPSGVSIISTPSSLRTWMSLLSGNWNIASGVIIGKSSIIVRMPAVIS